MIIYVDIDGTICNNTYGDYENAIPNFDYIAKINKFYNEGHEIIYWTARGRTTNIDWLKLTRKQLSEWGCKYHQLNPTSKPSWDLLIDDKTKRIEEI